MADDLFRKAALDKLASPERLDVLMQVTPPQDFIAKWTIAALIAAGLAYGFFGSSAVRVPGRGILRGGGGIQKLQAGGEGNVTMLALVNSQPVALDQLVASIQPVGEGQNNDAARIALETARQNESNVRSFEGGQMARAQASKSEAVALRDGYKRDYDRDLPLVKKGFMAESVLQGHQRKIDGKNGEIAQFDQQIRSSDQRIKDAESARRRAEVDFEKTTETTAVATEVHSPFSGIVINVMKKVGDHVATGDTLAEVEVDSAGATLEVVAFVPQSFGRTIAPGQPAQVTVNGIKQEEFGFLKGTVDQFSLTPVSGKQVDEALKSSGGSPSYRLVVKLIPDPNTVSKYAWSTGKGPPQELSGGVGANVNVETGTRRPISQFWLWVTGLFGS